MKLRSHTKSYMYPSQFPARPPWPLMFRSLAISDTFAHFLAKTMRMCALYNTTIPIGYAFFVNTRHNTSHNTFLSSQFCRDERRADFVATNIILSRQNMHTFVATKDVFCRDKHVFLGKCTHLSDEIQRTIKHKRFRLKVFLGCKKIDDNKFLKKGSKGRRQTRS